MIAQDVPGLVAGAAKGVGLGHAFLRHVERCHVILHLVDATSIDAVADFAMLNRELAQYGTIDKVFVYRTDSSNEDEKYATMENRDFVNFSKK